MKHTISLAHKIWFTLSIAIISTIFFSFFMTGYFYEKLYVENMELQLRQEGLALAEDYSGGVITKGFQQQVEWYNLKSNAEILLVQNPRDLSACLPFEVKYDSLVKEEEREALLRGEILAKVGYVERFHRKILGVMIPLLEGNRLQGMLYLYIPLASVRELTKEAIQIWSIAAFIFALGTIWLGHKIIERITKPLKEMEQVAMKLASGDFSEEVKVTSDDEMGQLGMAFNQMAQSIKEEDERKTEFLATVSHELRTPISYVKGYSEAIMDGVVTGEEQVRFLRLIHRESGRMERLVHDLLDLAKLDRGVVSLNRQPVVFAQLVEDLLVPYHSLLSEKQIHLEVDLDYDIIIEGDEDRLEQIFHNVMENAVRYTPEHGEICVQLQSDGEFSALSIRDSGIGIEAEHVRHLGERFYRVNKARTRKDGGTGLGLAIVKQLCELHGGKVQFDSELGKGTTVTAVFPILHL